jgi:mRNA-degrading endonuclease RelE of RelBE toxin-antitoxin system
MTRVSWDPKAREFLRKLEKDIAGHIYMAVDRKISQNVERYLESIKGYDFLKIRVGDYRLFVDYYKSEDLLVIRMIDHRENAYKHIRRIR